jgi:hypothetical protein
MRTKILFLLKFLLLSAGLLALWMSFAVQPYLEVLGRESAIALRLLGYLIFGSKADETKIYLAPDPDSSLSIEAVFLTLNVVVFVALVFSSVHVRWRRRFVYLAVGLLVLNLFQVLYVVAHYIVNFRYGPDSRAFQTLKSVSEILNLMLPVLLWALMEAPRLFRALRRPAERA